MERVSCAEGTDLRHALLCTHRPLKLAREPNQGIPALGLFIREVQALFTGALLLHVAARCCIPKWMRQYTPSWGVRHTKMWHGKTSTLYHYYMDMIDMQGT